MDNKVTFTDWNAELDKVMAEIDQYLDYCHDFILRKQTYYSVVLMYRRHLEELHPDFWRRDEQVWHLQKLIKDNEEKDSEWPYPFHYWKRWIKPTVPKLNGVKGKVMILTSTVDLTDNHEINLAKQLWLNNEPTGLPVTDSGLYRIFRSAYDGYKIDKYGYKDGE